MRKRCITTAALLCFVVLGCSQNGIRPMSRVGASLRRSAESRRLPSMGQRWLASLASRNGRERVELIDLNNDTPVPLNGINQADSQTISLSVTGPPTRRTHRINALPTQCQRFATTAHQSTWCTPLCKPRWEWPTVGRPGQPKRPMGCGLDSPPLIRGSALTNAERYRH
jgi:hypothetical protein